MPIFSSASRSFASTRLNEIYWNICWNVLWFRNSNVDMQASWLQLPSLILSRPREEHARISGKERGFSLLRICGGIYTWMKKLKSWRGPEARKRATAHSDERDFRWKPRILTATTIKAQTRVWKVVWEHFELCLTKKKSRLHRHEYEFKWVSSRMCIHPLQNNAESL